MQAQDVMSSPVVSVEPDTPVVEIAALLREKHIGGVPVLRGGQLAGIVTEKDLLHRHEIGTDRQRDAGTWWRRVVGLDPLPGQYVKANGRYARHVMSRRVIVTAAQAPLHVVAATFDKHRIGRVPVVEDGRVVGIVTCADLVKAIAEGKGVPRPGPTALGDEAIRKKLLLELRRQAWWKGDISDVVVTDGEVLFNGFVENEAQRLACHVAAENIAGVRGVVDRRLLGANLPEMF